MQRCRIVFLVYFAIYGLNLEKPGGRIKAMCGADPTFLRQKHQKEGIKMKYVKQIGIVLGMTMAGEVLYQVLPLPVPAGVYGLFIMLAALMGGAVKLESVEGTGNFLMDTMTMMFIPATVGIVESIAEVRAVLVPFLVIIAVSTVLVMIVTGRMAQWVMGRKEAKQGIKGGNAA